ncbi:MAG: ATP-binding protein [Clostridiaceae bacterium]|jgi:predicted AAA+ superfamily ATPase|nr:ATP-binding protein [Clostridiaceae bacterium]
MQREAMTRLIEWKNEPDHLPLIIRGARQVGKTWLMQEFGRNYFNKVAYINFENNSRMKTLFAGDFDITRILLGLEVETDMNISASDTLLIFDEIQEAPQALSSLKYFREKAPEYSILAAGSLLGVALHADTSFPVGKVDFIDLYPMNYLEFLAATGNDRLLDLLKSHNWDLIHTFRDKYIDLLRHYYFVGGMPEAVASFASNGLKNVRQIQTRLLAAYEQDFSKHAPNNIVPRIRQLWNSIPAQLAQDNKKFIYSQVQEGARAREYDLAMQWLSDCGLIHQVNRVTKPNIPLSAYADPKAFKTFTLDVGLLAAQSDLSINAILEGDKIFTEFKGALTEQYVYQQLASRQIKTYYWYGASAELDFLIQQSAEIVPIEVKAEENLKAKSLRSFCEKFQPKYAIRTSMSNFRREAWLTNIPLYSIVLLDDLLET